MQLPKGSGLETLNRVTQKSLQYYSGLLKSDRLPSIKLPIIKPPTIKPPSIRLPTVKLPSIDEIRKPVESLFKELNSAVLQLTAPPVKIDYHATVNSFLPPGAMLLRPQYPGSENEIQFADLDSDGRKELIASYRTCDGINTLVLKKDEVQWFKMAEISNPGFESIHYRSSADVAGYGKKYLLVGLVSPLNNRTLFAYELADGSANKIFSRDYGKLEVQKSRTASGTVVDAIAFWDEETAGIYNISLLRWNGIELEEINPSRYLANRVVPYHIKALRQKPDDVVNWYNLANSLYGAGDASRAARAIDFGLRYDPDPMLRSRFDSLKSML